MKKTKLASALLIGSLVAGGTVSVAYAVNDTVVKADDTQVQNQSDTTEIQTNSQTITRTIKYDLSDVQQYLKPVSNIQKIRHSRLQLCNKALRVLMVKSTMAIGQ